MARMSSFGSASSRAAAEPSAKPSPIIGRGGSNTARLRQPEIPWLRNAITKYRRWLLGLSVLPFIISFNGRWRVGLDSSIYRGLARSIAMGRGYHFGEFGTHQIYPG